MSDYAHKIIDFLIPDEKHTPVYLWMPLLFLAATLPFSRHLPTKLFDIIFFITIYILIVQRQSYTSMGLELPIFLFILVYVISGLFTPEPLAILLKAKRWKVLLLLLFLPYFRLTWNLKKQLLIVWLISSLVHAIYVVIQYFNGIDRPGGYFGYMFFAHFITFPLVLSVVMLRNNYSVWLKRISVIFFPIGLIALYATYTRGAWIAFAVAVVLFLFSKRQWKMLGLGAVLSVLSFSLILAVFPQTNFGTTLRSLVHPFKDSNARFTSNYNRVVMWQASIKMFKDNPFFGIGPHQFHDKYQVYISQLPPELYRKLEKNHTHPHSIYFNTLSATGGVGFLAFIYLLVSMYIVPFNLYRRSEKLFDKQLLLVCILAMTSFCVGGATDNLFYSRICLMNLVFLIGLGLRYPQAGSPACTSRGE